MPFELDPVLAADTFEVMSLELCDVRLMNDARFTWLILVPRRDAAVEILDLSPPDQDLLWSEIRVAAEALRTSCRPDKLNIGALGNLVAQLHVHVIARRRNDAAWPAPVWASGRPQPYGRKRDDVVRALESALIAAKSPLEQAR